MSKESGYLYHVILGPQIWKLTADNVKHFFQQRKLNKLIEMSNNNKL